MSQMPANVRITAQFPFPAGVSGAAPIVIAKLNGFFTVSLDVNDLALQIPPPANYATDFFLMWDSVAKTYFKIPLSGSVVGRARVQRSVTATPIVLAPTDEILNCNINAAAACALPAAATRNGLPLTFKDLGQAAAHNITLTPNGAEKIDGLASVALTQNYQAVTLVPFNDGTNTGWSIE